ncbi:MAG TPA: ABC transporter permease [Ktedonobacteraceae bacterium]
MSRALEPSSPPAKRPLPATAQSTALASLLAELRVRKSRRGTVTMLGANFESALDALWMNRLRSFLTALGIFIGVAAVIGALTLTQGASAQVNGQIGSLGNTVMVAPGSANNGGISGGTGSLSTLTLQDSQSLSSLPHVAAVSPLIVASAQVVYGNQNWSTQIEGAATSLQIIQNWQLAKGTWFSTDDQANGTPVALLGDTVWHNLFDTSGNNPIGQSIRIRDETFRVVGVLAPQGGGFAQDDVVIIPVTTAQIRLKNTSNVDQILVQVDDANNVAQVAQAVSDTLQKNHHILDPNNDDFTVQTFTQILQRVGQFSQILTLLLVGIAAISLTVGGIGIMNIMLVSVTERTWEIGIRISIGARRRDILNQFMVEALVLCLVGGLLGLGLGLLIGLGITKLSQLPFIVTPSTLILPFAVSGGIALVFGIYPAVMAARLDPIVAIRTDE